MATYAEVFGRHFREWTLSISQVQGFSPPPDEFYDEVRRRLTDRTVGWVGFGIAAGLISENGHVFNVKGNLPGKGPYKWFSDRGEADRPQCNWEYFVQTAFFARLWVPCEKAGLTLSFEDRLMDLTVKRSDNHLLWYIEVKEDALQVEDLLVNLVPVGRDGVDVGKEDRGNDPLRKAKYLVGYMPDFLTLLANDLELNFRVVYQVPNYFKLVAARPPLVPLHELPPLG